MMDSQHVNDVYFEALLERIGAGWLPTADELAAIPDQHIRGLAEHFSPLLGNLTGVDPVAARNILRGYLMERTERGGHAPPLHSCPVCGEANVVIDHFADTVTCNSCGRVSTFEFAADRQPAQPAEPTSPPAGKLSKLVARMRMGYIPPHEEMNGLSVEDMTQIHKMLDRGKIPDYRELMPVLDSRPDLTPEMLAQWVGQVAPLVEAEKVLIDWLDTVGGVAYAKAGGFGYYVLSTRPATDGINLNDGKAFSTFTQCLVFILGYAFETIDNAARLETFSKGYEAALDKMFEVIANMPLNLPATNITLIEGKPRNPEESPNA